LALPNGSLGVKSKVVEIVVPGLNNSESVFRFLNPDAIEIKTVNVSNPVASLRSMDVPVKEVAIQRVPITVFSMNDNLPSDLKLSVESFDTMTSSTEEYATVARDALLEMILALQRAAPICSQMSQAKIEQQQSVHETDALNSKTDVLMESLGRVVDGSIEATGLEVAKAAQKILQNREIWQANANRSLWVRQHTKELADQLGMELLAAVRHGITSIKTCAMASSLKVNLTKVAEDFFRSFSGKDSKDSTESRTITDLLAVQKAINMSANNLTLSQMLAHHLVQDAVTKANVSKQLNTLVDMKQEITQHLFERVQLAENISRETRRVPTQGELGTKNLTIGTSALLNSAGQATTLALQLQDLNARVEDFYNATLEADLHMKLGGLNLENALREALKTCAEGLRLAVDAGAQVEANISQIFLEVRGAFGNASSPLELLRAPGEFQAVQAAHAVNSAGQKAMSLLGTKQEQKTTLQEANTVPPSQEVEWTFPTSDQKKEDASPPLASATVAVESTTLLFGSPAETPEAPQKESTLLPNLVIAAVICLFLILGNALLWVISSY